MKKLGISAVFAAWLLGMCGTANGCGYGLFDPDVETFCSGDAVQAERALANLVKRGRAALPRIQRYREMAEGERIYQTRYVERLERRDPALKLEPAYMEKEAERARKWLEWNETRLRKIDYLLYRFGGKPFALNSIFRVFAV